MSSRYGHYNYGNKSSNGDMIYVVFIIIVILVSFGSCGIQNSNERTELGTVTEKYVKDDKYMIYCENEDGEMSVYEMTDTLVHGRFDTSDDFANIKIGNTYEFTVVGSRIQLTSMYPNIINYKEIKENTQGGTENE